MTTLGRHKCMPMCTALAAMLLLAGAGIAAEPAGNGQQLSDRTPQQQQASQSDAPAGSQSQQAAQTEVSNGRDRPLERQVAGRLREQGLGRKGQILILATDNHVILLGRVPDQNERQQAQQVAGQVPGVGRIDNRIVVGRETGRAGGTQLEQDIRQQIRRLGPQAQDIQVQAADGRIILRGRVGTWQDMADVIENAYEGGARSVQNQLQVAGQTAAAGPGFDDGYHPPYGYAPAPGDRIAGSSRQMTSWQRASISDLVLSQRVALALQQQLPGPVRIHTLDPQAIYVAANQGTVTLHGSVLDTNQKRQAEQIALSIRGVQSVRNELSVAMQAYEYPALGYVPGQGQENLSRNIGEQQQTTGERPATKQPPTTGQQQAGLSDMVLARRVALELQQQLPGNQIIYVLDQQAIDIMVTQGTVTLYGSVRTQSRKQHAEQIVRSIRQVLNVRNDLTVTGGAGEYPPLGYVPGQQDQGRQQQQQDRRVSGDAQCVQTLKQNITGRNLQDMAQNIYVICHDGEMALYGYVPSEEDRDRLGRIAAQIEGVTKVDNNIAVRRQGEEQKSDKQIKEDIESRLWWSPFVDSDKIDVSVENGTVTLSGEVEDWNAEKAAIKSAFDGGARRVKSRLQVKNQERGPQAGTTDDQQDDAAAQQQSRADQP